MARPALKWPEQVVQLLQIPVAKATLSELAHGNIQCNPAKMELLVTLSHLLPGGPLDDEAKPLLPSDAPSARKAAALLNLLVKPLSPSSMSQQQLFPRGQQYQKLDFWPELLHDLWFAVVVVLYRLRVTFAKSNVVMNDTQFQFPSSSQGE